jgi:hypothetical protein
LEGTYQGPHQLQVEFAYNGTPWDEFNAVVNATNVFSASLGVYGYGGGVYGTSTTGSIPGAATFGGLSTTYNLDFRPTQPCHSIRMRVTATQQLMSGGLTVAQPTAMLTVSDVAFKVADLGRGPYLSNSQKY